jgi:hypothetical protein
MFFTSSTPAANRSESYTRELRPRTAAPRARRPNRSGEAKRQRLLAWLIVAPSGLSVAELAALLGISRQLCLYHMKRLAATPGSGLTAVLEPCAANGGVQYRVWSDERLVEAVKRHGVGAWRRAA